jgi:predicted nucleic acid-binding protein
MPAETRSTRLAVDTNFLLDLAAGTAVCLEALETIRQRLPGPVILVPPTVIDELSIAYDDPTGVDTQRLAGTALTNLRAIWKFRPMDLEPVGHGIVERIAESIRERGYLPSEEVNDSFILAEAAFLGCILLVSADNHLLDVPAGPIKLLLNAYDVAAPLIVSPRKIARDFFPK